MKNTELINAYFDGELSEVDKETFIKRLNAEPDLKKEFDFHSDIIEGIKSARKAELKAKLDAVSVGAGGMSEGISVTKLVAIISGAALIATVSYFTLTKSENTQEILAPKEISEPIENLLPANSEDETDNNLEESIAGKEKQVLDKTQSISKNASSQAEIRKPEIHKPTLVEPLEIEEESDEEVAPVSGLEEKPSIAPSSIDISVDDSKRKYDFHYQLKEGKLYLFGSFDKGLYEILEFNSSEGKILYLFYKGNYYDIKQNSEEIQELKEVNEPSLIKSLESVRQK
ncbi:anti-sigma factor [Fulvivirga lutea]|uniref:Uncharacterized protein n=1 Tax=Fulvivirga lutea TaxID=2810512 RepID=A0A975A0U8_9BACT|nr:hypothetical protein [Fulvivirga lutea]QSE96852.1 hypothetical protein JR347_14800 [Fulvivirga lutea]